MTSITLPVCIHQGSGCFRLSPRIRRHAGVYPQPHARFRRPDLVDRTYASVYPEPGGKPEHVLAPGDIPVIQSDRGWPSNLSWARANYGLLAAGSAQKNGCTRPCLRYRGFSAAFATLYDISRSCARVRQESMLAQKIAQLGLRVSKGCSYHGLSLNVDMDLEPFSRINPVACWIPP